MKRTPEQAAKVAAWLNMLDHVEAQLQALGAIKNPVRGRGPCVWDRVRFLKSELSEAQEQVATLTHNLETVIQANKAGKVRAVARGRKSRETIAGLEREVARLTEASTRADDLAHVNETLQTYSSAIRLELGNLAKLLGCDCAPQKMIEAVKALKGGEPKVRQREAHGGGVDEHGNAFEFAADERGAVRWFTFNGRHIKNERVAHKAHAVLADGTRLCRIIRTGDGWAAIHKALTTPEDGDDTSEVGDGPLHDRALVDKPDAQAARSAKVRR